MSKNFNVFGLKPCSYCDGRLLSTRFINPETGQEESYGIASRYEYDFGEAVEREEMHVLQGVMFVGDEVYKPGDKPLIFEKGEEIKFAILEMTAYHCLFGTIPPDTKE